MRLIQQSSKIIQFILLLPIKFYRYFISPMFGSACRFEPTCSKYAEEAIKKHGAIKGGFMALKRIVKCNPFHKGGYDPVKD